MLQVTIEIGRDKTVPVKEMPDEDYDMGYFMKTSIFDTTHTCNSPLILRKHHLKGVTKLNTGKFEYTYGEAWDLIERATGKVLGQTDVYNNDMIGVAETEDFEQHIMEVARQYETFVQDLKNMKIVQY